MRWSAALPLLALALSAAASAQAKSPLSDVDDPIIGSYKARGLAAEVTEANCGGGSYSVQNSPDGTSISVLFDNFTASGAQAMAGSAHTNCVVQIPLNLPAGYSWGVPDGLPRFRPPGRGAERPAERRLWGRPPRSGSQFPPRRPRRLRWRLRLQREPRRGPDEARRLRRGRRPQHDRCARPEVQRRVSRRPGDPGFRGRRGARRRGLRRRPEEVPQLRSVAAKA
uniref:DUF4360 domain-containing protein n=1 Tax=Phenylobacterium glaciei TaxID=2803784 RepID=A0A974P6Q2_9CAUL|nr:DUF4360 domain-containing protein [Phenylobacterium glaciei]